MIMTELNMYIREGESPKHECIIDGIRGKYMMIPWRCDNRCRTEDASDYIRQLRYSILVDGKDNLPMIVFCSYRCALEFHEHVVGMILKDLKKKGFSVFHEICPNEIRTMRLLGCLKRELKKPDVYLISAAEYDGTLLYR